MKTEREKSADDCTPAARGWARRCAAGMSAAEQAEFKARLAADPSHARALARANPGGVDCDWAWQTGTVDEILAGVGARVRRRRNRRAALAGVAMLLVATTAAWRLIHATGSDAATRPLATTLAVIRPSLQTLPDGSVVELKDDAMISTDFSGTRRAVSLSHGTAYFQVARDASRPFVVTVAGLAVQAVGTAFAVELDDREIKVLVAEGKVRVDPAHEAAAPVSIAEPEPLVSLGAGGAAVFPLAPGVAAAPVPRVLDHGELQQALGWRIPKLEFTRTPLREVIAQMNRHNACKFVLGDESVGEVRVSGILRADKVDTLADTLQTDFGLRAERRAREIVLRRAR